MDAVQKNEKTYEPLSRDIVAELRGFDWPGNVRELEARIKEYVATDNPDCLLRKEEDAVSFGGNGPVGPSVQPTTQVEHAPPPAEERSKITLLPLKEAARRAVESTERALIEEALQQTRWNRRQAAKLLEISYSSLLRRIESYGIGKRDMG